MLLQQLCCVCQTRAQPEHASCGYGAQKQYETKRALMLTVLLRQGCCNTAGHSTRQQHLTLQLAPHKVQHSTI